MVGILRGFVNNFKGFRLHRAMSANREPKTVNKDYLVWIDLEMTGLNVDAHKIVEVACILTDTELNEISECLHIVVHEPKHVYENECDQWPREVHERSGLMQESLESSISIDETDFRVSNYIKSNTNFECNSGNYYLAGNSVYMDKRFLERYMPLTHKLFHYHLVDVSCLKTLCNFWYPEEFKKTPKKQNTHRAHEDIRESIKELRYYRENILKTT